MTSHDITKSMYLPDYSDGIWLIGPSGLPQQLLDRIVACKAKNLEFTDRVLDHKERSPVAAFIQAIEPTFCWGRPTGAPIHNEAVGASLTKGSTMSTTKNLRKDEVRNLPSGALSNDELAIVTGGGSIRIVCDDHKVIGQRPK